MRIASARKRSAIRLPCYGGGPATVPPEAPELRRSMARVCDVGRRSDPHRVPVARVVKGRLADPEQAERKDEIVVQMQK